VVRREASALDTVEVTGHVESLTPFYRRASVAVASMRFGAGVKLKTVMAMLWGVPVLATTVGAEGVEGPDVFFAVEDDATALASAIARALDEPAAALEVASRAHAWAHSRYSTDAYARELERIYE
jgi:glycosyltransferase involved in cell wall biosynthesis